MKKPKKEKQKPKKYSREEIEEIRKAGVLINDEGEFCREVPECTCGMCRSDGYGGYVP